MHKMNSLTTQVALWGHLQGEDLSRFYGSCGNAWFFSHQGVVSDESMPIGTFFFSAAVWICIVHLCRLDVYSHGRKRLSRSCQEEELIFSLCITSSLQRRQVFEWKQKFAFLVSLVGICKTLPFRTPTIKTSYKNIYNKESKPHLFDSVSKSPDQKQHKQEQWFHHKTFGQSTGSQLMTNQQQPYCPAWSGNTNFQVHHRHFHRSNG